MIQLFSSIISSVHDWIWTPPLLIFIICVGGYLTFITRGVQFRYFWYAHRFAFTPHANTNKSDGDISHFQALMTALSGTIGIGSITGVATAIAIGGVGAIFWMWIAAIFGMATKFGEALLAIKYRIIDDKNQMSGGPMYYIEKGLKCKWLAVVFSIFGIMATIGTGNTVQANAVALALQETLSLPPIWGGILLSIAVGITLIKGIKSIGAVNSIIVPSMALFYILGGLIILAFNIDQIPHAFLLIIRSAFSNQAAVGGLLGGSVLVAIQTGISRSIFSSEAGLGSSPVVAASAQTDVPGRQALVSMCTVFLTVGIVCTITALVIIVTGDFTDATRIIDASTIMLHAFDQYIPYGSFVVTISLIFFAYSTMLGWAYCGEKYVEYLVGSTKGIVVFRLFYILLIIPASLINMYTVWNFASIMNACMTIPNLIALLGLGHIIKTEMHSFDKQIALEKTSR